MLPRIFQSPSIVNVSALKGVKFAFGKTHNIISNTWNTRLQRPKHFIMLRILLLSLLLSILAIGFDKQRRIVTSVAEDKGPIRRVENSVDRRNESIVFDRVPQQIVNL